MEETVLEVVRYCTDFDVDEIIWKIDTEEFSHGLPELDRIRAYLPWLNQSRDMLFALGVGMSINPWVTQGMRDAGLDNRPVHPDFEWMTDISGVQAKAIACPLSPAWRRWLTDAYLLYASTGPRVLWVEDDIRVHGHRPVMWACFCDRHLRAFSQRMGRTFTRQELADELLRPGTPSPVRGAWLDFEGEVIEQILRELAQAIHGRHPEVQVGIMVSAVWSHAMECRHWDEVWKALSGPHGYVTMRPCMGNYHETDPRGLYDAWHLASGTLAAVQRPVHACTEIENWPFTRFSKSVRFARSQLLLSAALRCPSMTLNLYDHVGTPLCEEPQYGRMLQEVRPRLDALVEAYGPEGIERGFAVLNPLDGGKHKMLPPGANYGDLSMGRESWAAVLQALGLPATTAAGPVAAVSGPRLQAYRERLEDIFSASVLLDLSAAETVIQMGRGDLIGVSIAETFLRGERATPAEEPCDPAFGRTGAYMTVDHLGLRARVGRYEPHPGARVISHLVDPDRSPVQPGFVLFENHLGGRVALCPYALHGAPLPVWFLNWHRGSQMRAVAAWLFRDRLPLAVEGGAYALPIRTDYPGATLVSALNLSCDDWPETVLTLAAPVAASRGEVLQPDGGWQALPPDALQRRGDLVVVKVRQPLPFLDMLTVRLT